MTAIMDPVKIPPRNVNQANPQEPDSGMRLHFLPMMATAGEPLDVVRDAGEGEGREASRRLVYDFDPHAKSRGAGLMHVK